MTREEKGQGHQVVDPETGLATRGPSRLAWPFKRLYWAIEKYILWPIADSFKWFSNAFRYRSPFAYIGATLAFAITAGAVATAVYFHNQSVKPENQAVVAQVPPAQEGQSVVLPTKAPVETSGTGEVKSGNTLKGVTPNFKTAADSKNVPDASKASIKDLAKSDPTIVTPAKAPSSGPLKTAHNFADTFVSYEIGKKGAAKDFKKSATKQLASSLAANPPRQPSSGSVPKATVMNVVKGPTKAGKLGVSVALLRLGTSSELRLSLEQSGKGKHKRWLVSEVLG